MTDARWLALGSWVCLAAAVVLLSLAGESGSSPLDDYVTTAFGGFVLLGWMGLTFAVVQRDLLAGFACMFPTLVSILFLFVVFQPRD
jgi:hypothetical protein